MSEIAIKVENLSKQYRLGVVGTGTLSHDLNRWWAIIRGKDDPYLKIGESNDRTASASSDYVWALKDISFSVNRGDVLGIIGKNGAGKSTLLKILSKVTGPTTGEIRAKGRIGALLEVGTGFHPELTGRENVFLNGAILGMTKPEIKSKLDEIVDFSGCLKYIDTPVKRYSSGMKVRLAFAVAAFLEPEILIVDEVLAVGDAEFQKKAIGRMKDISRGEGRTVLFVSHNMGAVTSLCNKGLLIQDGMVSFSGDVNATVNEYLLNERAQANWELGEYSDDRVTLKRVSFKRIGGEYTDKFDIRDDVLIEFNYSSKVDFDWYQITLVLLKELTPVFETYSLEGESGTGKIHIKGDHRIVYKIPGELLKAGLYTLKLYHAYRGEEVGFVQRHFNTTPTFEVEEMSINVSNQSFRRDRAGVIINPGGWF